MESPDDCLTEITTGLLRLLTFICGHCRPTPTRTPGSWSVCIASSWPGLAGQTVEDPGHAMEVGSLWRMFLPRPLHSGWSGGVHWDLGKRKTERSVWQRQLGIIIMMITTLRRQHIFPALSSEEGEDEEWMKEIWAVKNGHSCKTQHWRMAIDEELL